MFEIHGHTEGIRQTELKRLQALYLSDFDADTFLTEDLALALADAVASLQREGPDHYTAMRTWTDYEIEGGALRARSVCEIQADAAVTREAITQGG